MTGLDKMVARILDEAKSAADIKRKDAASQAAAIKESAEKEAKAGCDKIKQKSAADVRALEERSLSAIDLMRRTEILKAKQELIRETVQKAYDTFCNVEGIAYYAVLEDMVRKFARPEDGQMLLSAADYAAMPEGFAEKIADAAKQAGGSLTIAQTEDKLDKGFILSYGGIEENCSFKALFADKKDELGDRVSKLLFP